MNALFYAHSGLRYLVLLAGLVSALYFGFALGSGRTAGKDVRIFGASFVGLLDLQVLLGIALVSLGRWYPALIGHIVCMLAAAVLAHVLTAVNRRKAKPGYALPLFAVVGALLLVVLGILAIGRNPLATGRPTIFVQTQPPAAQ